MSDFCNAYWALEDAAAKHGLTMDELELMADDPRRSAPGGYCYGWLREPDAEREHIFHARCAPVWADRDVRHIEELPGLSEFCDGCGEKL